MTPAGSFLISKRSTILLILVIVLVIGGAVGWGEYQNFKLRGLVTLQSKEYSDKFASLASTTLESQIIIQDMNTRLSMLTNESVALSGAIQNEQIKNQVIEEKVGKVSSTIGSLDKLSKTDPQLLQKYSKVYFLNEHYTPNGLAALPSEFTFNKDIAYQVHANVLPKLTTMLRDMKSAGLNPQVISAYRSYNTQVALKAGYKTTFGAGTANQFSADQGYSEHQLGTTLDFTTPKVGATLDSFDKTPEYTWLVNNAHRYGFVLSYPKGNKYYVYEPWHWRYVGVDLATRLKRDSQYFYDLDQRVIDNYLLLIFE